MKSYHFCYFTCQYAAKLAVPSVVLSRVIMTTPGMSMSLNNMYILTKAFRLLEDVLLSFSVFPPFIMHRLEYTKFMKVCSALSFIFKGLWLNSVSYFCFFFNCFMIEIAMDSISYTNISCRLLVRLLYVYCSVIIPQYTWKFYLFTALCSPHQCAVPSSHKDCKFAITNKI